MNDATIRSLLMLRLTGVSALPTEVENGAFKPTEGVAFQSAYLLKGETQNPTMGDQFRMPVGILQVTLAYPLGKGTEAVDEAAAAIIAGFPRGWSATAGNGTVRVVRTPYASGGFRDNGFWKVPITVPYVVQSFGN